VCDYGAIIITSKRRGGNPMNQRIKAIREQAGLSQEKFAESISLTKNYISLVENGKRQLSDRTVSDLCEAYNINETWLRTGEGEMYVVHTIEDALGDLFDAVTNDPPDAFRKKVFLGLANLSPDDWETVERILNKMLGKKEEPGQ
jgi:transcriptional regulator with XRE-family HTH domain